MKGFSKISCLLTALFLIVAGSKIYAQDTLITVKGEFIPVKLVEIQKSKILFTEASKATDSAVMEMPLSELFIIKFSNGLKKSFPEHLINNQAEPNLSAAELAKLGTHDAHAYFAPKPRVLGVAGITLLNPPAGLIVALTTNKAPHPDISSTQNPELLNNEQYIAAFRKEGKRIKKGKSLRGFVAGFGAYLLIVSVLVGDMGE